MVKPMKPASPLKKSQYGVSMIETVFAIPVLLFLGLAALQWMLVFQARYALTTALQDAARAGSVGNAQEVAIAAGFARGLVPYLYGASDLGSFQANLVRAAGHVQFAQAQGFGQLKMLSPTSESFTDWARPAKDSLGEVIAGLEEIPNDNLAGLAANQKVKGSAPGERLGYSVGGVSQQSLSDANILKLELTYGVPLRVPFVGRLTIVALKTINGCSTSAPSAACSAYDSVDEAGQAVARLPIVISAQVRMQTPARRSGYTVASTAVPFTGEAIGAGIVGASTDFKVPAIQVNNANANSSSPIPKGQAGFLQFGADRTPIPPTICSPA
jgi:hypothetical protein